MCAKLFVPASRVSNLMSVIPTCHVLWLVVFAVIWTMTGHGGIAIGQVVGVDDPFDMADASGDIKRIEAWVDDGTLNLTMTVYGVFAPTVQQTPAGMSNRYYYHWILDTDNNPATGYNNSEYEGNATKVKTPIGVDLVVQFGWRDGNTNGVYAYEALTEASLFEDYAYTIDGDTIHALIPLADLGLSPNDTIGVSAFQEGASNGWQVDWAESFLLPLTVVKASNPIPAADDSDIARDVILTWDAGALAATHTVYLGTDWADVNGATLPTARNLEVNSFDPGRLDFGQTYYWRVDEVNSAPDFTAFKGDVWRFTVEPLAIPIENITATASAANIGMGPEKTVDGSGLNDMDQHSDQPLDMWSAGGPDPIWIKYDFDRPYKLHEMKVWNSNQAIELFMGFGIKEVTIEYSGDGESWTALDGVLELAQATGLSSYTANSTVAFEGVIAQSVRLSVISTHGNLGQSGLAEVRFLAIPTYARAPQFTSSQDADQAGGQLQWRAGREAAEHEVWLGTDTDTLTLLGSAAENRIETGALNYATSYVWSVTEVNQIETLSHYTGDIWRFTTEAYGIVDDFESYTAAEGHEVFMTWKDGYGGDASLGGSVTGHINGPFVETSIVNSGKQSMPVYIDNDGGFVNIDGKGSSPAFSEVMRDIDRQDWTASGIKTLSILFAGSAGLTGQLYLKIDDTKIVYNGDASNLGDSAWRTWNIDLSAVGAKLADVRALAIGVEGNTSGILYIDDIRLYP